MNRDVLGNRHPQALQELAGWFLYDVARMSMNEWDRAYFERNLSNMLRKLGYTRAAPPSAAPEGGK